MIFLCAAIFLLIIIWFIIAVERKLNTMYDYEEEVTTTTYETWGVIHRSWENGQPYVYDPVDRTKVWLNTKDDMYEDASGRVWELH